MHLALEFKRSHLECGIELSLAFVLGGRANLGILSVLRSTDLFVKSALLTGLRVVLLCVRCGPPFPRPL